MDLGLVNVKIPGNFSEISEFSCSKARHCARRRGVLVNRMQNRRFSGPKMTYTEGWLDLWRLSTYRDAALGQTQLLNRLER